MVKYEKRKEKMFRLLKFSTIKTASVSEIKFQYFSVKESVILNKEKTRKEKRIIDKEF